MKKCKAGIDAQLPFSRLMVPLVNRAGGKGGRINREHMNTTIRQRHRYLQNPPTRALHGEGPGWSHASGDPGWGAI